jgi:hypothetical protein
MENCSNIFAYAHNMLLACTPTINWFLFGKHFTYFSLLPRIRYSISCAMAGPLCDFLPCPLQALDVISLYIFKKKNPCSFWSYPCMQQRIMIHFYFHTKVCEIKTEYVQVRRLCHYSLTLPAILKLCFPGSICYSTGICKPHLPSWLFSGCVWFFFPACIIWKSLC